MNLIRPSRFETVSGAAFFFQILMAVPQRVDAVLRCEIHECRQRCLAKLGRTPERNFIFAIKLNRQQSGRFLREIPLLKICRPHKCRGQLYANSVHSLKLPYPRCIVMRFHPTPTAFPLLVKHLLWPDLEIAPVH